MSQVAFVVTTHYGSSTENKARDVGFLGDDYKWHAELVDAKLFRDATDILRFIVQHKGYEVGWWKNYCASAQVVRLEAHP